ncbi:MAG: hypothetical protein KF861_20145 [Planctomycetaceae bacterium]|nr:hypothetical protein [Planctomycetaceae bacterium]
MWHKQRFWSLQAVESAEKLTQQLTEFTWTGCQAFELGGYILANDATSPNGAQEYGVLRPDPDDDSRLIQIESITFSWCSEARALELLQRMLRGEFDLHVLGHLGRSQFQAPERHGFCPLCR